MPIHEKAQLVAPYVMYEWKMFKSAAKMIGLLAKPSDKRTVYLHRVMNEKYAEVAFLESFLLHARNLCDFLFMKAPENGDQVVAEHYFDSDDYWKRRELDAGHYLADNKLRLYHTVSRLHFQRPEHGWMGLDRWDLHAIETELNLAWNEFYEALPMDRQHWFMQPIYQAGRNGNGSHAPRSLQTGQA